MFIAYIKHVLSCLHNRYIRKYRWPRNQRVEVEPGYLVFYCADDTVSFKTQVKPSSPWNFYKKYTERMKYIGAAKRARARGFNSRHELSQTKFNVKPKIGAN